MTKKEKQQTAIDQLKEMIQEGDTLYTTCEHVSRSGMTRHLTVRSLLPSDRGERQIDVLNFNYLVSEALDWTLTKDHYLKIGGCGMDMGFHLVYTLSRVLFDDGYALKHQWL